MEINITILIQMIIFIFYIIFCIKYIWPYINKVIEKRQKKIYLENCKIIEAKKELLLLKKKIKKKILQGEKKFSKIILEAKNNSIFLSKKYKKKAFIKYKHLLYKSKKKIYFRKKIIYEKLYENISIIINTILVNITSKVFNNKKKENQFINKMLDKFKTKF